VDEVRVFHPLFKSENPAAVADFREDLSAHSEDIYKGALVDTGFWALARKLYQDAVKDSKVRTEAARKENPGASGNQRSADDDTPVATAEQLIGKEVVRFQGFRVAFFALDSDSKLACLDPESGEPRRHEGDYIVLNRIVSLKEDAGKGTNT
jgi:glutaminyl-tRNA synthetase